MTDVTTRSDADTSRNDAALAADRRYMTVWGGYLKDAQTRLNDELRKEAYRDADLIEELQASIASYQASLDAVSRRYYARSSGLDLEPAPGAGPDATPAPDHDAYRRQKDEQAAEIRRRNAEAIQRFFAEESARVDGRLHHQIARGMVGLFQFMLGLIVLGVEALMQIAMDLIQFFIDLIEFIQDIDKALKRHASKKRRRR